MNNQSKKKADLLQEKAKVAVKKLSDSIADVTASVQKLSQKVYLLL